MACTQVPSIPVGVKIRAGGEQKGDHHAGAAAKQIADAHEEGGERREQHSSAKRIEQVSRPLRINVRILYVAKRTGFNMSDETTGREAKKDLPAAARRALAEADERRARQEKSAAAKEIGGPKGKEPTRYGDWERKGRAVDF